MAEPSECHPDAQNSPSIRVAYFSNESRNEGVRRRLNELLRAGFDVTMFSFRRRRDDKGAVEFSGGSGFRNVDLGELREKQFSLSRALKLLQAIMVIARSRRLIAHSQIVVGRDLDMGILAFAAMLMCTSRAKLVYEVLDINFLLLRKSNIRRILRAAEWLLLKRIDLLVVSSPSSISQYFNAHYRRLPETVLVENKISFPPGMGLPPRAAPPLNEALPVWTIGYFGKLRCLRSLRHLARLASEMPDRVRVYIRGYPNAFSQTEFEETIAGIPNVHYEGSYRTPHDLPEIMKNVHLNWCMDLRSFNRNASWLLPNRIYEGGYFGTPLLGVVGSETGKYIAEHELGHVLPTEDYEDLKSFISTLTLESYRRLRAKAEETPREYFVDKGEYVEAIRRLVAK